MIAHEARRHLRTIAAIAAIATIVAATAALGGCSADERLSPKLVRELQVDAEALGAELVAEIRAEWSTTRGAPESVETPLLSADGMSDLTSWEWTQVVALRSPQTPLAIRATDAIAAHLIAAGWSHSTAERPHEASDQPRTVIDRFRDTIDGDPWYIEVVATIESREGDGVGRPDDTVRVVVVSPMTRG